MRFRKKPVEVEAIQWDNVPGTFHKILDPEFNKLNRAVTTTVDGVLQIDTLEGVHDASIGDWIIQGVNGEIYPCKPDIFEKTYEAVE